MPKITEDTLIPLSLMVILAGGIFWLSAIFSTGQANSQAIEKLQVQQSDYSKDMTEVKRSLGRIEGKLGILSE